MRRDIDNLEDDKARGDAILKTQGDQLQAEIFAHMRANTHAKTLEWLQETHGIQIKSGATLTEFWKWYRRTRFLERAARASSRLEEALPKLADARITADQARQVAQVEFELQAAEESDPDLFSALRKGELERDRLTLEREKFEWSKKTDIERALDALFDEIKGCPAALEHYHAMRAAVAKNVTPPKGALQ